MVSRLEESLRYMAEMNLCTVYPNPNLSKPAKNAVKMPYLLKNLKIERPNQVWAIDITYISMKKSHMYLTAVIDWNTRFIVGCALSDTLDTARLFWKQWRKQSDNMADLKSSLLTRAVSLSVKTTQAG